MGMNMDALMRPRWWELRITVKAMTNLTPEALDFFFTVIVEGVDKRRPPQLKLLHEYTPKYHLAPDKDKEGRRLDLPNGYAVYNKVNFCLSYKELARHNIKVDMWKINSLTFNKYFGTYTDLLSKAANSAPNRSLLITRMYAKAVADKMRREKKAFGHVALVDCVIQLEEIFDFNLLCDNWMFELSRNYTDFESKKKERKNLHLRCPGIKDRCQGKGSKM